MRRLLLATSLLAATTFPVLAGTQDFKLVNKTGYQINEVYVSHTSAKTWGNDIMGSGALGANEFVNITFNAPDDACTWDLKVTYSDGDTAEWSSVNLCNISTVTLFWDKSAGTTRATAE